MRSRLRHCSAGRQAGLYPHRPQPHRQCWIGVTSPVCPTPREPHAHLCRWADCRELSALAVDGAHTRLFAACGNMKMLVLNGGTGEQVASFPIGPGTEAIGYDAGGD